MLLDAGPPQAHWEYQCICITGQYKHFCYDPDPNFRFTPSSLSPRSPTPTATYLHPRDALPRPTVKVPSLPVHFPSPHAPAEPPATSDDLIKVRPFHSSHAVPDCPTTVLLSSRNLLEV